MKKDNKALYEQIMCNVSKLLKRTLNEDGNGEAELYMVYPVLKWVNDNIMVEPTNILIFSSHEGALEWSVNSIFDNTYGYVYDYIDKKCYEYDDADEENGLYTEDELDVENIYTLNGHSCWVDSIDRSRDMYDASLDLYTLVIETIKLN